MNIKEKILISARKEFLAKGYEKASLRKITKDAGYSVAVIYKHFKSKDDLFRQIVGNVKLNRYGAENNPEEFVMILERDLVVNDDLLRKLAGLEPEILLSLL